MDKFRYSREELKMIEESQIAVAVYQFMDSKVVTIALSWGFSELFGYTGMEKQDVYDLMDNDMYRDTHPDDMASLEEAAYTFATAGGAYDVIYRSKKAGEYRIIHAYGKHVYKDGARLAVIWYTDQGLYKGDGKREKDGLFNAFKDQLAERSYAIRAEHDFLTGLPAMSYFFNLAEPGCKALRTAGKTPFILFMDFNGMKVFNQKYGLEEGDNFLRNFADRIASIFHRENCSRFNADHFCVFTDEETALAGAQRLIDANEENSGEKRMPLRIGVYRYDDPEISISGACDRAKIACDIGRNSYFSKIYIYENSMMTRIEEKQYVVENIDQAVENGWIKVFYQPIVRTVNGRVCYEEALARWDDPERGFLSPGAFIPALEESDTIYKLDLCVVDIVLRKLKEQEENGLFLVPQSVNLSRSDFYTCDIVEEIRRRVDSAGLSRKLIVIEITESIMADDVDYMIGEINRFKELGFTVWMDDYGSGFSSPEILHRAPFDLLKIDMLFIKQLEEDEKSRIILTEIVRMAMSLGMDTIAEGVETESQAAFLKNIGCTMLQGFYFCRPISVEDIFERYRTGKQIGFENPAESEYFAQLGRVNMYNLSHSSTDEEEERDYFDTWPMIMVECVGDKLTVVKTNITFKKYIKNYYPKALGMRSLDAAKYESVPGGLVLKAVRQCAGDGKRGIIEDSTDRGNKIQILVWRVAVNPLTGAAAVMAVVLTALEMGEKLSTGAYGGEQYPAEEYDRLQQENARLKEEVDAGKRIAELEKSISDLLTNMPAMTFTKDVVTRKYLACNQAFADYAHKDTPDGVVGLTDFEIFDDETAQHFIDDDKKALEMDRPYIFYENVPDAAGYPRQFQTTKLKFTDNTGRMCLLGLCQDVTEAMLIKREYDEKLAMVQNKAEIDALTGIKNKNSYKEREELMDRRIMEHRQPEFAIVVFDVNDLKKTNDTRGHEAGDKLIREACGIICKTFKRSPVYRIGGDEFVVISQDEDYERSDELVEIIARHNEEALNGGGVVIACGMARFDNDDCVSTVFRNADRKMYDNKNKLKERARENEIYYTES